MNLKSTLLIPIVILAVFSSCTTKNNKETLQNSLEFDKAREEIKSQTLKIIYNIPSPTEVPALLEATGADFDPSLVNEVVNADYYKTTSTKSALNLGVYAADIGYFSSYEKAQNVVNYLAASRQLAEQLGAGSIFDMDLFSRFEKNLSSKDSLANIVNEAIHKTDQYLHDHSRFKLGAMVLTGSFVEGLYLSTALVRNYPRDILPEDSRNLILLPLMRVILDQEKALGELLELYKSIGETESELYIKLSDLKAEYASLNITEKLQKNRPDLVIAESLLEGVTIKVGKLRDYITGLN